MTTVHTSRYAQAYRKLTDRRIELESMTRRLCADSGRLQPDQQTLLSMVLEQGNSFRQIASLAGQHPSTVSRRFRQLMGRLESGAFGRAVSASGRFDPLETAILIEYYVRGATHKAIIGKLGTSRYRIRKTLRRLSAGTSQSR